MAIIGLTLLFDIMNVYVFIISRWWWEPRYSFRASWKGH